MVKAKDMDDGLGADSEKAKELAFSEQENTQDATTQHVRPSLRAHGQYLHNTYP